MFCILIETDLFDFSTEAVKFVKCVYIRPCVSYAVWNTVHVKRTAADKCGHVVKVATRKNINFYPTVLSTVALMLQCCVCLSVVCLYGIYCG